MGFEPTRKLLLRLPRQYSDFTESVSNARVRKAGTFERLGFVHQADADAEQSEKRRSAGPKVNAPIVKNHVT